MNLKNIFSLVLVTLFSLPSLHASEHLKKAAVTTLVAASTLSGQSEKKEKVIKNRKGETFTFHGDGTVSVRDVFGNDLGTYPTNNDNPLLHQSIELVKEGDKSGVFVGLGVNGGISLQEWIEEIGLKKSHYDALVKEGIEDLEDLDDLDEDDLKELCEECNIRLAYKAKFIKGLMARRAKQNSEVKITVFHDKEVLLKMAFAKSSKSLLCCSVSDMVFDAWIKKKFPSQKKEEICSSCLAQESQFCLYWGNVESDDCRQKSFAAHKRHCQRKFFFSSSDDLSLVHHYLGGGSNIFDMKASNWDESKYKGLRIPIKSYHVSCDSYKPKKLYGNEELGGIVLYSVFVGFCGYGFSDEKGWKLPTGSTGYPGYIILKRSKDISHIKGPGMIHGAVYKSFFKKDLCPKHVIGGGFSYSYNDRDKKDYFKWKFNSFTFNTATKDFHDNEKGMNPIESKWIMKAMKNWIEQGRQNTEVTDQLVLAQM